MPESPDQLTILKSRIKKLGGASVPADAKCVLYIMSRDCRTRHNFALLASQQHALKAKLPLVVAFTVYDRRLGQRAREHVSFLLRGLEDVAADLARQNIGFVLRIGRVPLVWREVSTEVQAAAVYFDFSPLRHSRQSQETFARRADCPVFVVDTHNIVPVWVASSKAEIGARTLRPKIHHYLPTYLQDSPLRKHPYDFIGRLRSEKLAAVIQAVAAAYPSNGSDISRFTPGEMAGQQAISQFIATRLRGYAAKRNDPSEAGLSELSPYLHYGFIHSLAVALAAYDAVRADPGLQTDADALIEEMVVRKELSDNHCYYSPQYDALAGAPEWAQQTLIKHQADPREFIYKRRQFEAAETHDEAWNAAQRQLTRTGKIHGYMRMYWAKKVLEWSLSPEEALETLLYLNDFYHIDGGDPNGYVGIMWSIAGTHDRPWGERPVYGTIRSMVYGGLKRKFDIKKYIEMYPPA